MLNTNEPETHLSHKPRCEFVTQTMLNTYEPKTHLSHKPRYEFVTQTMLNTNEPETHLPHKPRYKFVTQTILSTNEPEPHLLLKYVIFPLNRAIPKKEFFTEKRIFYLKLCQKKKMKLNQFFHAKETFTLKSIPKLMDSVWHCMLLKEKLLDFDAVVQRLFHKILSMSLKCILPVS